MSEQAKRAEEVWQDLRFAEDKISVLAAALQAAERRGYLVAAHYYDDRGTEDAELELEAARLLSEKEGL